MKIEFVHGNLLLVSESDYDSLMIDKAFGSTVQDDDGFIANVSGEVRLSDGYGDHYIILKKNES